MPLIRSAADRGDPRAQYVLGLTHFNADYAEKDWVRAYALMTLANSAGLPQAADALAQMDQYVPQEQRQQSQALARKMEAAANQRRATELAAIDLGQTPVSATPAPVASAPAPVPVRAAPAAAPVRVASATPQPVRVAPQPKQSAPRGNWKVQLGAFGVASNADRLWSKLANNPALAGTSKALVPGGGVTRLQAVGFASRAQAQSACNTLKAQGQGCLVKQ